MAVGVRDTARWRAQHTASHAVFIETVTGTIINTTVTTIFSLPVTASYFCIFQGGIGRAQLRDEQESGPDDHLLHERHHWDPQDGGALLRQLRAGFCGQFKVPGDGASGGSKTQEAGERAGRQRQEWESES